MTAYESPCFSESDENESFFIDISFLEFVLVFKSFELKSLIAFNKDMRDISIEVLFFLFFFEILGWDKFKFLLFF